MSEKFLGNVLLVDGSYMLFRAMTQPGLAELQTRGGRPSGGIFGFLRMISSVVKKYPGYYPIVVWDKGRSPRRLELYPNYKHTADRIANPVLPGTPDDEFLSSLREQRGSVMDYLTSIRIPCIRIPDWEGDDLIYLLTKRCNKCIVVTDDKDYIQLCSPTCKIDRTMAGEVIEYETRDPYYEYPRYEYYKAIVGDGSDNISQCTEGIGGKSADKIASVMANFVKMSQCNPHDYQIIFNYLRSEELLPEWKSVRGLSKKISKFLECEEKFTLNMKLMDFNYVEEPEEIRMIIESQIIPIINKAPSVMSAYRILGRYEISEIDPGSLMSQLVGSSTVLLSN